ncbi:hypothetical protein N7447_008578 [Penicillium robsamsonii]|uniref:uncharacterized protein n=1 Tax=Penicillium robsamsonii TaxID=1792511 RepID=UPI002548F55D|nr:uncharacterized protein N7447_008578 [Penicillium robsamsonii]KAJ5816345.1 hypothetical protein N7447_008578 [Penicillium robsamsonii]
MDNGKGKNNGKNKGKGRGKKRSQNRKENKATKKVERNTKVENQPKVEIYDGHHCRRKRPTHVRSLRCLRLGHVVQCPEHPESFPRRLSECVKCNSADKRQVQQERNDRKK